MTSPEHLEAAWSELERQGAVVRRVPVGGLSRSELGALMEHEQRRLRALAERHLPAPEPFDWHRWRAVRVAASERALRISVCRVERLALSAARFREAA